MKLTPIPKSSSVVVPTQPTAVPLNCAPSPASQRRRRRRDSIYAHEDATIAAVWEAAPSPQRLAIVVFDYAKLKHRAMIINGLGKVLRQPFTVHNNAEGLRFLAEALQATLRQHGIEVPHVLYAGEDCPAYVQNFLRNLHQTGRAVVTRVSAAEAAKHRENLSSSTDDLDLFGIAKAVLARRTQLVFAPAKGRPGSRAAADDAVPTTADHVEALRELMRQRRRLVGIHTGLKNQTHSLMEKLFPTFLEQSKSGLRPFGKGSLALMADGLDAAQLAAPKTAARATARVVKILTSKAGYARPRAETAAQTLQALAQSVLPPSPAQIRPLQQNAHSCVLALRNLTDVEDGLKAAMASHLRYLPAAFFTSLPGVGVVLASGVAAELGPDFHLRPFGRQCAYAGIVPRTHQSGGPDKPAHVGKPSKRCNHILKDYLVQIAMKQKTHGCEQFQNEFTQLEADGKPARLIMARRMLRLLRALNRDATIYRPPHLRPAQTAQQPTAQADCATATPHPAPDMETPMAERLYYHELLEKIIPKWTIGPDWLENFSDDTQWGILLRGLDSLYQLGLAIPKPKGTKREANRTANQSMPSKTKQSMQTTEPDAPLADAGKTTARRRKNFQPDDPYQVPDDHGDHRSKPKRIL
jgi:transposase